MASTSYHKHKTKVYYKYNCRCAYCGIILKITDMQIDHIIPRSNFNYIINNREKIPIELQHLTANDVHSLDNLNPSCLTCNKLKGNLSLELFKVKFKSKFYYENE